MKTRGLFRRIKVLCLATAFVFLLPFTVVAQDSDDSAPAEAEANAEAPKKKRLGVLAVPRRAADADKALLIQTLFRSETQSLKGGGLVLPVDGGSPAELDEVQGWVDEGTVLMRGNRFTDAKSLYRRAANVLEGFTGIPDRRLFARAFKGRAIVAMMASDKEGATDFAQRSLLFWPSQLDSAWGYNMETSRLHRSVTVGWETTPDGGVQVETSPGQAEVFVNGMSRGFAPVTVEQLRTGTHHILVTKDGYVAQSKWVKVESEKLTPVDISLAPTASSSALTASLKKFPRFSAKSKRAATHLKIVADAHGGLDSLLVLVVSVSGKSFKLEGMVYTADGRVEPVKEDLRQDAFLLGNVKGIVRNVFGLEFDEVDEDSPLEPPTAQAGAAGVEGEAGAAVFIAGGGEVFQEKKKSRAKSIYSEWWFWTGAAVSVGGIVTTAVLLAGEDSEAKGPTGNVRLNFHTPVHK